MGDLVPVSDHIAGEIDTPPKVRVFDGCSRAGSTVSGTVVGACIGLGVGLFEITSVAGEIAINGALVGTVGESVLLFLRKTNAFIDMILVIRPVAMRSLIVLLKTLIN
jgi:hypothetical protein